jgi:hypothetical protein
MDDFARRPAGDRRGFIEEAAARRDVTSIIIEKDFWVCWTLRRLARAAEIAGHLTFKGGTSLSKAYGIISRFSEDIDLTIGRSAPLVEKVASPMEEGISGKERERRTKALKLAAETFVADVTLPALQKEIEAALGSADGWKLEIDPDDADRQTLLFLYPRTSGFGLNYGNDYGGADGGGYIKPRVKLEFGARGETEPSEPRPIRPYLADDFPDEFKEPVTEVATLAVERTYWEKVTILHALNHNGKLREGMSRHYHDVLMLDQAGVTQQALARLDLLDSVVRNKGVMFADNTASYETAGPGTLRLAASDKVEALLRQDYGAMGEMFMGEPIPFEQLLKELAAVEAKINGA